MQKNFEIILFYYFHILPITIISSFFQLIIFPYFSSKNGVSIFFQYRKKGTNQQNITISQTNVYPPILQTFVYLASCDTSYVIIL